MGRLSVVATPIGNLQDLTPRARLTLEEANRIFCEDTRRTLKLLSALGISNRLERFDEHASEKQIERAISGLLSGEHIALVSDAGTPGLSDPGAKLVIAAQRESILITPIPGPSALTSLLSVSGFSQTEFCFLGFFPRKSTERKKQLEAIMKFPLFQVFAWFESPMRITETLEFISGIQPLLRAVVGKELTKLYEKIFYGDIKSVSEQVKKEITEQGTLGEWCFAIQCEKASAQEEKSLDWVNTLECLMNARVSASEAARQVSQYFGVQKKSVYEMALKISKKKITEGG